MPDSITLRGFLDEDFIQYKKPAMFLGTATCDWKCCHDAGCDVSMCQNSPLANSPVHTVSYADLFDRYIHNPITTAIVVGGLEPFLQFEELRGLIAYFRQKECLDDFVIYTGYYPQEITQQLVSLRMLNTIYGGTIIIKFGRYVPGSAPVQDPVLCVTLASSNQYAERL